MSAVQERFLQFQSAYAKAMSVFATIGGIATFTIMVLIDANALGRKIFNAPVPGSVELTEALMALLIMLPMAYTQCKGEHLRVTLLLDHLPYPLRRFLFTVTTIFAALFVAAMAYALYLFALRSFRIDEYVWGAHFRFPIYPVKGLICVGAAMLSFQFMLDAIRVGIFNLAAERDGILEEPAAGQSDDG